MNVSKCILIALLIVLPVVCVSAEPFNPIRDDVCTWTCYDYTLDFVDKYGDDGGWYVTTISNNRKFVGRSHMVACRQSGEYIEVYDVTNCHTYFIRMDSLRYNNPYHEYSFYKVWGRDQVPHRNWKKLIENIGGFKFDNRYAIEGDSKTNDSSLSRM